MKSQQCHFVTKAGRRCRAQSIAGTKYCAWHRQDGGPRPSRAIHHLHTPSLAKTNSERLAELMLRLARIKNYAGQVDKPATILWLVRRYGYYLEELFDRLEQEVSQGRALDKVVKQATEYDLQTILRRERQKTVTDPNVRNPRYWAIFGFITGYIARYRRCPSQKEIAAAIKVRSRPQVAKYLSRLEEDGLLIRLTKPQNSRAYYVSPQIKNRL